MHVPLYFFVCEVQVNMKIIEKLSDKISCEISSAEQYAKCALEYKEDRPVLAEAMYKIANGKLEHMGLLHTQVVAIINEYKQSKGQPPEAMKTLYQILHRKHIEHAAAVKGMLALYKEM